MTTSTSVAVIILNWQQALLTQVTINSLIKARLPPKTKPKIYLIDNFSQDSSWQILKNKYKDHPKIKLFRTKSNLGYAGGNNYGLKQALKDKNNQFFLVSNNDVFFHPNFLKPLIKQFIDQPKTGIVGPKIYFAPGYEFHRHRYQPKQIGHIIWSAGGKIDWANTLGSNIGVDQFDHGQHDQSKTNLDFVTGCCFLTSRSVLKKVGLFDPHYFMYWEDVDFCQRIKQAGFKVTYQPQSVVWHINSGSSSSGSQLQDYYITRNRLCFAKKYSSFRSRLALHRQAIKFIFGRNSTKRQAVIDYYLHAKKKK